MALGGVLAHVLNADVQQRYLDAASSSATLIAKVGIQPLLNPQEVAGGLSPTEISQTDERLQGAAVGEEVRRIKVWNPGGMIVYSDNHSLIGKTFAIDDDLASALAGHSSGSITSGHDEENAGDTLAGPLVQVYVPLVFNGNSSPSGAFELYLPYAPVQAAIDRESNQLYVFLAAGLALFYASMFPVALLADRWRRRLLHEAQATALANLGVLERLNRLKTEFLTRISHQFRTSMVGIQGFSEVIRDSDRLDPDEVRAFASDIFNDADRLNRAFNDMLELDGIETGRIALKVDRLDLNALIKEVVEATRGQTANHVFSVRLDPSVPRVSCDKDKIGQVLTILLTNAAKYSPVGTEIVVSSQTQAGNFVVTVKDRGIGMPAEVDNPWSARSQDRRPVHDDLLKPGVGAGLGLTIARQIVEMHGGHVWFDSTAGQGSEFHFALPGQVKASTDSLAVARHP